MKYNWIDYTAEYAPIVESWLDLEAKKNTGCDEGFDQEFEYWKNDSNTKIGENFWGKVVCDGGAPFAVIAAGFYDGIFIICELIVDPAKRGKGHGPSALSELLACGKEIIGHEIISAEAVIFPSNTASQKAFAKAGFIFDRAHPDGDAWYYIYGKDMKSQ